MQIHPIDLSLWPELAAQFADLGFEHSVTYGQAAAARIGATLECVALMEGDRPIAAAMLRVKRLPGLGQGIAWCPGGPLMVHPGEKAPDAEKISIILARLRAYVTGQGHILRLRLPGLGFHDSDQVKKMMTQAGFIPTERAPLYQSCAIDLTPNDDGLMAKFAGKWRTDLRYALKSDLALEVGKDEAIRARFMSLFNTIQRAKGFSPDITPDFHFALSGNDYDWQVLIASKNGVDLGGIVVGFSGTGAVYLFGATADPGRKLRAGYFLTWSGLLMAQERGCVWYDLGGIDADENPAVARFKSRMNGVPLLAHPYEARPAGAIGMMIGGLEGLHARIKAIR